MESSEQNYLWPAMIGGGLAGVVSAVPFLNCLCCLWIIAGAVFSCYLLAESAKKNKVTLRINDGLLVGTLSGIWAGLVNTIIEIPLTPISQNIARRFMESLSRFVEEMPEGWEKILQMRSQGFSISFLALNLLLSCLIFGFFGALGGLVGFSLFKPSSGERNAQKAKDQSDSQPGF